MEHVKKMMLIDSHDFRNVKQHHSAIDRDISDVLNRQGLDDVEKLRLYQQTLNKFLISRQNIENELDKPFKVEQTNTPILDRKDVADNVKIVSEVDKELMKQDDLHTLPKTKKVKKTPKKESRHHFTPLSLPRKRRRTQKKNWEFY
jgi:hypothetical protein